MSVTQEDLSQDLGQIMQAVEAYKRAEAGSTTQLIQTLEAMKMHVEGPSTYLARMRYQPLLNMCVTIALETGIMKSLVQRSGSPVSSHEVSLETGQDEVLVMRVLRQLYVNGVCEESGPATYCSNSVTETLEKPEYRAGCTIMHDMGFSIGANLVNQIRTTGIQMFPKKPSDKTPFHFTYGMHLFDHLKANPEHKNAFDDYMIGRKGDIRSSWIDLYPAEKLVSDGPAPNTVSVVDVGGGVGTDLMNFGTRHRGNSGRLVLEDLSETLERLEGLPIDIEKVEYNFFTMEQPVKGARAYFMHAIIHDWSDEQAREILQGTARAMKKDHSVLLIQDMVLPDTGASWRGSTLDILMLMFPGGMERTKMQWESLLNSAGLELCKVWTDANMIESVIEAQLKD
ncbi:MAG: hypothetical protein M1831_007100 [Alyxoria varia]|nr:MAG: hypothetical protein M1831_007100 [Alyxoria varia]